MATVKGLEARSARMRRMASAEAHRTRMAALYAIGQRIEVDAEISITAGSVSGKNHQPSAPGQPPNADTRLLDTSIETTLEKNDEVHVTSNAPYSAALEYGTSKMAERPFMRPALEKNRAQIGRDMATVQAKISKG